MTILQSIILGIIQGITEFLPVSSSGHLVIFPYLAGWEFPQSESFVFNVLVQVATLVAVIAYFWDDLWKIFRYFLTGLISRQPFVDSNSRMGWYLILATIPAGLIGLMFKDFFEQLFNSPASAAFSLFVTAILLLLAELVGNNSRKFSEITWLDGLWMGLFQAVAIFPGISRSGSTIVGGMLRNLDRPSAARFSFLMSIPVMLAAGLLASIDLFTTPGLITMLPTFTFGFIASAVVGYFSIHWLLKFLSRQPLYYFSIYCVILGAITLFIYYS